MPVYIPTAEAMPVSGDDSDDPFNTKFSVYKTSADFEEVEIPSEGLFWEIRGSDMQVLHVDNIAQGTELMTEIGSTMYLSPGITTDVECALCGDAATRVLSGENCVKVILRNETPENGYIGLTPNFPAKIIPVTLSSDEGNYDGNAMNTLISKSGAIMANVGSEVSVTCNSDFNPKTCCCAGLGCCRQQISTGEAGPSTVFLAAGGTILSKILEEGETITVDKRSILAFADTVKLDVRGVGGLYFCCCGGEGLFLPTLTGPGLVLLESMSYAKVQQAFTPTQTQEMDRGAEDTDGGDGDFFNNG